MQNLLAQVFTQRDIVNFMLDEMGFWDKNILQKSILDPSCGDGAFLTEIAKRIVKLSDNEDIEKHLKYVLGWELDKIQAEKCNENLNLIYKTIYNIKNCDSIVYGLSIYKDDLFQENQKFDYIVGNPPYIGYNECCNQKIDFTLKIKDKCSILIE